MNGLESKLNLGILEEYVADIDIIIFTETLCNSPSLSSLKNSALKDKVVITPKNKRTEDRFAGTHGITIFINPNLSEGIQELQLDTVSNGVVWLKLSKNLIGVEIILGCVYLTCESSVYFYQEIFTDLESDLALINSNFNAYICLVGDFNARTGLLDDFLDFDESIVKDFGVDGMLDLCNVKDKFVELGLDSNRYNCDREVNNHGRRLIEMCQSTDMKIMNGRLDKDKAIGAFTCYNKNGGKSAIDYAIASYELFTMVKGFEIGIYDKCLSDVHCAIYLTLCGRTTSTINYVDQDTSDISTNDTDRTNGITKHRYNWNGLNKTLYRNALELIDVNDLVLGIEEASSNPSQENMDKLWDTLNVHLIDTAKSIGVCKVQSCRRGNMRKNKKQNKPWFNAHCQEKKLKYLDLKRKLRNKPVNDRTEDDFKSISVAASQYKKFIKREKAAYFINLNTQIMDLKSDCPKDYWSTINKASDKTRSLIPISMTQLQNHFEKLSFKSCADDEIQFNPKEVSYSINEDLNCEFTEKELKVLMGKLKNNKAMGIDSIPNEVLKCLSDKWLTVICMMFNLVLNSGTVPNNWCIGLIMPLYKNKGSRNDPDNYRGITLLSCIGKLFTAALNLRIAKFLDQVGLLGDEQVGFREGYSTQDHIFVLHCIIDIYLHRKQKLYCAFIDYRKAFDLVDRSSLWVKLLRSGVNGKVINVIYNLYSQAKSCVFVNGETSDSFACNIGVRQGENLSPLLFAIFLNDFEYYVSRRYRGLSKLANDAVNYLSDDDVVVFLRLYTLLYADDTIVLAENAQELQNALNAVHDYCQEWKLTVNTLKTKVVVFSRGKIRSIPAFTFGSDNLEVVDSYVYLGILFNYNGSFKKHLSRQITLAKRALFSLSAKAKCLQLNIDVQCHLFKSVVLPIIFYGCEVWGYEELSQLEIFQRNFLKRLLNLKVWTPSCMIYGETNTQKLIGMVKQRMICFWFKLISNKKRTLSKNMYFLMKGLHDDCNNDYKSKWISNIENVLNTIGMRNLWLYEGDGFTFNYVKNSVKLRLADIDMQDWHSEVDSHNQCHFYALLKVKPAIQHYTLLLPFKERSNLLRFICRNHRLPVSRNRFRTVDRQELMCNKCMLDVVGDEFHYLFTCPFFDVERKRYLGKRKFQNPNLFNVRALFLSPSLVLLKKLAKFICCIVSLFDVDDDVNFGAINLSLREAVPSNYTTSRGRAISRPSRYADFYIV